MPASPNSNASVSFASANPHTKETESMRLFWLVLLSCLLVACQAPHAADSLEDARRWQGAWKLVSSTYDGEPQMADMHWVVNGDHYNIRLNQHLGEDPYTFKLDASQQHIDVTHHETPKGTYGGNLTGIYEISGDSLKVCYDLTGQQYPKSFDATKGSRQVLYQFQRE
jgi:uncharacterized protein (TIGR03067 family)